MIYDEAGAVRGVATRDVGIGKDGAPKGSFARGTEIRARQTILTEGCRGSCSEEVMKTFGLRDHENVAETFTGTVSTKVEPQSCVKRNKRGQITNQVRVGRGGRFLDIVSFTTRAGRQHGGGACVRARVRAVDSAATQA